jgi:hypothetical protein
LRLYLLIGGSEDKIRDSASVKVAGNPATMKYENMRTPACVKGIVPPIIQAEWFSQESELLERGRGIEGLRDDQRTNQKSETRDQNAEVGERG